MKKAVTILLVLAVLCTAVIALADTGLITDPNDTYAKGSSPSKTTEALVWFKVDVENPVAGKVVRIIPINEITVPDVSVYEKNFAIADAEIADAKAKKTVEGYFGEELAKQVTDYLGTEELCLDELFPILQYGYEESMGAAAVTTGVFTPYEKDEKVTAFIGLVEKDADGNEVVVWKAFNALGTGEDSIAYTVDADTLLKTNTEIALFATVSKAEDK